MLSKLSPRDVCFVLWGLGKLGFNWSDDMLRPVQSISNGKEVTPLGLGAVRYLRDHIYDLGEQDLSILLYSFGELKMPWNKLSPNIESQISNQMFLLKDNLSPRSLANCLFGLARAGAKWRTLSIVMRNSILFSLFQINTDVTESDQEPSNSKRFNGLAAMNPMELSQSAYSLGLMEVRYSDFNIHQQERFLRSIDMVSSKMSPHGRSTCILGLATMKIDKSALTAIDSLLSQVIEDLQRPECNIDDVSSDFLTDQNFCQRYLTSLKALSKLQVSLSIDQKSAMSDNYKRICGGR